MDNIANSEKVRYHSTQAFIHLNELLRCQLPFLSQESRQAIDTVISVTDRLSGGDKKHGEE